jgi:hypothetical protein
LKEKDGDFILFSAGQPQKVVEEEQEIENLLKVYKLDKDV